MGVATDRGTTVRASGGFTHARAPTPEPICVFDSLSLQPRQSHKLLCARQRVGRRKKLLNSILWRASPLFFLRFSDRAAVYTHSLLSPCGDWNRNWNWNSCGPRPNFESLLVSVVWCKPARLTTLVARSKNGVIWICYMLWHQIFRESADTTILSKY